MITSRRDYILGIIEDIGRLLSRIRSRRDSNETDEAALETVVFGFQRLIGLDPDQVFQLTPDQHFGLLVHDEPPDIARDKVLLYAALSREAGHLYLRRGNRAMARATFVNALRFTLKAAILYPAQGVPGELPAYAPSTADLLAVLAGEPLDAETEELLRAAGGGTEG